MLMSDVEILEALEKRELAIEPFSKENLGPDNVDIHLGSELLVCRKVGGTLDPLKKNNGEWFEKVSLEKPFELKTHQFILANTKEKISLSNSIAAAIEGRSSIGRYGIVVHMTAGIIHAGFGAKTPSTLTLEIYSVNPNPVLIHQNMKIAQLSFFRLGKPAHTGYDFSSGSKYVGQSAPEAPKVYLDRK